MKFESSLPRLGKPVIIISTVLLQFLSLLACGIFSSPEEIVVIVTSTPAPPTKAPTATHTAVPSATPTESPEPTKTPLPTETPLPQAEIWSITLEDAYKMFYALGYSAEMYPTEKYPAGKDSWAVYFYDPSSYYESDYWYWYGNSVYAWSETAADLIFQVSITKNYLDFPVSAIDSRADKFFRRILEDLGFEDAIIDEIMTLLTSKLPNAREDVGEILCYGRLQSGEYVSIWLEQSEYGYYWYSLDIRTSPICGISTNSSDL